VKSDCSKKQIVNRISFFALIYLLLERERQTTPLEKGSKAAHDVAVKAARTRWEKHKTRSNRQKNAAQTRKNKKGK